MPSLTANPEPDTFRRLVEGEIGVDEYVKSLDERVREGTDQPAADPPRPPEHDPERAKP